MYFFPGLTRNLMLIILKVLRGNELIVLQSWSGLSFGPCFSLHFCHLCTQIRFWMALFNLGSSGEVSFKEVISSSISAVTGSSWSLWHPVGMWCDAALSRTAERSSHLFGSLLEENACSGWPLLPVCIYHSWPF